ncbi:MAG: ATP-dependent 6-phosphofructokinase [Acetobacteraceae bacterium]|nr:ATP-dependent 6-phosphofructokinase [Acetobacteraceae bacterium]
MRLGLLTGGGDCPGLNAAIRAVVAQAERYGLEVVGIERGWAGLLEPASRPLTWAEVEGLVGVGGTLVLTSRTNPLKQEEGPDQVAANIERLGLEALLAVGGDDTLAVALALSRDGVPVVGVPKTMDNDVGGTDYTIGYHTAAAIGAEAVERLHTTARSHSRVMVLEVMGREAGWVALGAGLGGGAHLTLVPEAPVALDDVVRWVERRHRRGASYTVVVVAEGAKIGGLQLPDYAARGRDAFGHVRLGGVGEDLAEAVGRASGLEARSTSLGHVQRGGPPVLFDRLLGTRLGLEAVEAVRRREFGRMVALRGTEVSTLPLEDALSQTPRLVDRELLEQLRPVLWL